ncbi:hypothetical protein O181_072140 [Austropuccinia psidii MF-1]|uniref:Uncharacterized protein n=1 Tax=Austropuccinia psidii MF-1 TaxID=1389203 RepID=A0A9Q3EZX6_9BASI|nr:hypothetical protein [Austropuccinia psidii MF-1]
MSQLKTTSTGCCSCPWGVGLAALVLLLRFVWLECAIDGHGRRRDPPRIPAWADIGISAYRHIGISDYRRLAGWRGVESHLQRIPHSQQKASLDGDPGRWPSLAADRRSVASLESGLWTLPWLRSLTGMDQSIPGIGLSLGFALKFDSLSSISSYHSQSSGQASAFEKPFRQQTPLRSPSAVLAPVPVPFLEIVVFWHPAMRWPCSEALQ